MATQDEFDPIQYIERSFTDNRKEPLTGGDDDLDLDLPTLGEFVGENNSEADPKATKPRAKRKISPSLSAPRPRRVRNIAFADSALDPDLVDIWTRLPKNVEFLSQFFDDTVTANYYTGVFKETRQELIRRLLDPELTLEEVSRLLGVCPATVRRYTNRGWLDHHRTKGGQRRFRLASVFKFVEQHGRAPQDV